MARQGPRVEDDLDAVRAELRQRVPAGRVFARLEWGEYLTWKFFPEYKVFMDGRIEIYPDDVWEQYSAVTRGEAEWHAILDRYDVDALVLDARYHALTGLLPRVEASGQWHCVYRCRDVLLFLRTGQGIARAR